MAFTTQTFLFVFLPISLLLYFIVVILQTKGLLVKFFDRIRATDLILIGIGCAFYMWACFDDVFRFLLYILVVYLLGKALETARKREFSGGTPLKEQKVFPLTWFILLIGVVFVVYTLAHFKYSAMLTDLWNYLFKDSKEPKSFVAPLGISFITFSAISYLADIYKGKAESGNLIDCLLYMTFFPKVVSGPIVLWRDFKEQIRSKDINFNNFVEGLNRLMIGFAKKLILADTFGACIASATGAIDIPTAFGVSILFMLQIYYDFSGYSDIAIGLSKMLGIGVKENFNFPYLSTSISDFWRRWHVSLGTWFREYVYIPLGGNRKGTKRTIINIAIVFLLTGIWHGAGWTYILWGAINGFCNIIEKLIADKKFYVKTPTVIKWVLTMAITFVCWQIFRPADINACEEWFKIMFGRVGFDNIAYNWRYYFDAQMITLMVIAIVGSTVFGLPQVRAFGQKLFATKGGYVAKQIIILSLFALSIMFMINSDYSPFLYFQY